MKKDLGYVGCSSDVLTAMDYMCSGLRQCDFRVPELDVLVDTSSMPCMEELVKYLEASYECIKGTLQHLLISDSELVHAVAAMTEFSSFSCPREMGSVPNGDGINNGNMGLLSTSEGAATTA